MGRAEWIREGMEGKEKEETVVCIQNKQKKIINKKKKATISSTKQKLFHWDYSCFVKEQVGL